MAHTPLTAGKPLDRIADVLRAADPSCLKVALAPWLPDLVTMALESSDNPTNGTPLTACRSVGEPSVSDRGGQTEIEVSVEFSRGVLLRQAALRISLDSSGQLRSLCWSCRIPENSTTRACVHPAPR